MDEKVGDGKASQEQSPSVRVLSRVERRRSLASQQKNTLRSKKRNTSEKRRSSRSSTKKRKNRRRRGREESEEGSEDDGKWKVKQMELIQEMVRDEMKKQVQNNTGDSLPKSDDINISLDSADDYIFRIKQFEKYGIRSVLDRNDHSSARRVEMEYWRMKHALEQREMENNCSTVISVGADLVETFFKGIKFTLIETEGLASVVKKALEDGKFHSSIRYYVQTTSDRSALTNPSVSFLTTFASILFFNHVQKKNEKAQKKKKRASVSDTNPWNTYASATKHRRHGRSGRAKKHQDPFLRRQKRPTRTSPSTAASVQAPTAYRDVPRSTYAPGRPLAFDAVSSQRDSFATYSQHNVQGRRATFEVREDHARMRLIDDTDTEIEEGANNGFLSSLVPIASEIGKHGRTQQEVEQEMWDLEHSTLAAQSRPKIEEIR